ncbi:hypothetical protein HG66A1_38050 [Gimesia chilikensis]|nr:hypothetical protein HG66A1_38050 [Gimesia chilikensis]
MNHTFDRDPSTKMVTEITARREEALSHNEKPDNQGKLTERHHDRLKCIVPVHTLSGVILGILILHPVTMVIYCFEFHPELTDVRKRLKGSPQKVRRAEILLKADVRGPNWTDKKIAEAFSCRVQTIENLRKRLVVDGFEIALNGKTRESPPRQKVLVGKQEARVIAMRLGKPSKGYVNWSLRLLAERVVELGLVESISHETIRQTLKKTV